MLWLMKNSGLGMLGSAAGPGKGMLTAARLVLNWSIQVMSWDTARFLRSKGMHW